ncbi:MAG: YciI family protein [gamma proteobacterium symbiont of Bathyaustriella thionipta]|nr:YciI family protein [gamma proteobacterium symbiont of Bathyaustriella thionipta]
MPKFIFVYLGGEFPASPAESQKHFQKYQQWLDSLGDAVISPAIPFKDTHTIQPNGTATPGTMSSISGFSIVQLNSMQEALKIAQSCPFLEINGTLEVSQMIEMSNDLNSGNSKTIN